MTAKMKKDAPDWMREVPDEESAFLLWIHDRLILMHGEEVLSPHMVRIRRNVIAMKRAEGDMRDG